METYWCSRCSEFLFEGNVTTTIKVECPKCRRQNIIGPLKASKDFDIVAGIKNNMLEGRMNG